MVRFSSSSTSNLSFSRYWIQVLLLLDKAIWTILVELIHAFDILDFYNLQEAYLLNRSLC